MEVHLPIAVYPSFRAQSFDCQLQALMLRKWQLSPAVPWPAGDTHDACATLVTELTQSRDARGQSAERAVLETLAELEPGVAWTIAGDSIVLH